MVRIKGWSKLSSSLEHVYWSRRDGSFSVKIQDTKKDYLGLNKWSVIKSKTLNNNYLEQSITETLGVKSAREDAIKFMRSHQDG